MRRPQLVQVLELFGAERDSLVHLLRELSIAEWELPTVCANWNVRDVAVHLLGGYAGNLSRGRDRVPWATLPPGNDFAHRINRHNAIWVEAGRRLSPDVIVDLLEHLGPQLDRHFQSLDLEAPAEVIPWAGPEIAPTWLHLAREFTEHWHHQQHVRDAVGRPGCTEERYVSAVLRTFAHALPVAVGSVNAPAGASALFEAIGPGGGVWSVVRGERAWELWEGDAADPAARVSVDVETAWRGYTFGLARSTVRERATMSGRTDLADALIRAVAIIA